MITQHILTETERKNLINCLQKSCEFCKEIEQDIYNYRMGNGIDSGVVYRSEQDKYLTEIQDKTESCMNLLRELIYSLKI